MGHPAHRIGSDVPRADMHASVLPDLNAPVRDIARPDFVRLWKTETIFEALSRVRREKVGERVVYFYVTDRDGRLIGVAPTRKLLLSPASTVVGDIIVSPVVSVHESEPFRNALEIFAQRRLLALPVVDDAGRLKGVLDAADFTDRVVDFERWESAEEVFQLIGVHMAALRRRSAAAIFGKRFPWLLSTIAGGLGGAVISRHFDHLLSSVVALAFFVPLVLSLSESIAMQSVTMSLDRLHVSAGGAGRGDLFREVRVGLLLGLTCGAIVGLVGVAWLRHYPVAGIVAGGVLIAGASGAIIGFSVPRLVRRWKLNPTVASGPVALALTDVAALACYFTLSSFVLR